MYWSKNKVITVLTLRKQRSDDEDIGSNETPSQIPSHMPYAICIYYLHSSYHSTLSTNFIQVLCVSFSFVPASAATSASVIMKLKISLLIAFNIYNWPKYNFAIGIAKKKT